MFLMKQIFVAVTIYTLTTMMVGSKNSSIIMIIQQLLTGLKFELSRDVILSYGFTVEEDVGTVDLCITYRGDNVPPVIDAAFHERTYGNQ